MKRWFWTGVRRVYPRDPLTTGLAFIATLIGLLFIYDAGFARAMQKNPGYIPPEFRQQLLYIAASMLAYWAGRRMSANTWRKLATPSVIIIILLLLCVTLVGKEMNGAKRWIDLKVFTLQPSEFAKLVVVIALASAFAGRKRWEEVRRKARDKFEWLDRNLWTRLTRWLPALWVLVIIFFVLDEKDLGTAAVIGSTAFAVSWLGGAHKKTLLWGVVLAVISVGVLVKVEPYRKDRIVNHFHRWSPQNVDDTGYQTVQSELGQAIGGWKGVGMGNGRVKHMIPAPTTDFIMGTIGEETGVFGALAVIGLMAAISLRLMKQAIKSKDDFARLVLGGTAAWFGIQASVNVMMANASLPAIGIPLPFISSGGSSLVALWLAVGVCNSMIAPAKSKEATPDAVSNNRWRDGRTRLSSA